MINNLNIKSITKISTPKLIIDEIPNEYNKFILNSRKTISNILNKKDKRLLIGLVFSLVTHLFLFTLFPSKEDKLLGDKYIPIEVINLDTPIIKGDSIEKNEQITKKITPIQEQKINKKRKPLFEEKVKEEKQDFLDNKNNFSISQTEPAR